MANEIPISVVDRKIKVGRHVPATMTNIGKDYLSISLDNEWSSTNHRLRVTLYSEAPYVSVQNWWDGKSAIEIPQEITSCPAFKVTVALLSEDGHERLVTQAMDEPIENPRNGHDEGAEPGARTIDIIARIDNLAADLEEKRDTDYWRGEPGTPGAPGAPGEPGADGYSPTANVTKNGGTATITVTDKNGTTTATVSDGAPGSDANVTKENVEAALGYEPLKGLSIGSTDVTPVGGVVDVPIASFDKYGAVKSGSAVDGVYVDSDGVIRIQIAGITQINDRSTRYQPINPQFLDYAVKAAMCDGKGAAWTDNEQQAARERMNAADANKVYIMQKQIENLQGIAATEETDSTEAYTKTVPTGAQKWASLDKVGGKTAVWNQLEGLEISELNYPTWDMSNQTVTDGVLSGHLTGNYGGFNNSLEDRTPLTVGHKYLFLVDANFPVGIDMFVRIGGEGSTAKIYGGTGAFQTMSVIQTATDGMTKWIVVQSGGFSDYDAQIKNPQIFDLTQMFGAGNEPSTVEEFRAMFPADYYPYNTGELMSAEVVEVVSKGTFPIPQAVREMCPGYGWSAGTACNEIDFGRKVYVQRVGSVDLGTLSYWNGSTDISGKYRFGSDSVKDIKPITHNVLTKDLRYSAYTYNCVDGIEISTQGAIYIFDSRYEKAADFKSAMQGVMLYYELATPIEVDLSDVLPDDNFIEVEAGGTVTFKQSSTQLPVPSSVTYQISTKEVVSNA